MRAIKKGRVVLRCCDGSALRYGAGWQLYDTYMALTCDLQGDYTAVAVTGEGSYRACGAVAPGVYHLPAATQGFFLADGDTARFYGAIGRDFDAANTAGVAAALRILRRSHGKRMVADVTPPKPAQPGEAALRIQVEPSAPEEALAAEQPGGEGEPDGAQPLAFTQRLSLDEILERFACDNPFPGRLDGRFAAPALGGEESYILGKLNYSGKNLLFTAFPCPSPMVMPAEFTGALAGRDGRMYWTSCVELEDD